ncbi:MAG: hypothetical protein RL681_342, partial [Candidatus Parcubacteria bacterium]
MTNASLRRALVSVVVCSIILSSGLSGISGSLQLAKADDTTVADPLPPAADLAPADPGPVLVHDAPVDSALAPAEDISTPSDEVVTPPIESEANPTSPEGEVTVPVDPSTSSGQVAPSDALATDETTPSADTSSTPSDASVTPELAPGTEHSNILENVGMSVESVSTTEEVVPPAEPVAELSPATDSLDAPSQPADAPLTSVDLPQLTTDKDDYHPGETASIFGRFFGALQNVVLKIFGYDESGTNGYVEEVQNVTADEQGSFTTTYTLDGVYRPLYNIVASALDGTPLAQTSFADTDTGFDVPTATHTPNSWSNNTVANVQSSNNARTNTTGITNQQGYSNFGFGIPAGAVINGIEVAVESQTSDSGCAIGVNLSWDGTNYATQQTFTLNSANTDTSHTFGASGSLWAGHTWVASDFSDANFVVRLQGVDPGTSCSGGTATFAVDQLQVRVTYTNNHTITASAGAGGTITPSGAVSVSDGSNQSFSSAPSAGNVLSDVLVDSVSQGRANTYAFTNVTANHTIAASFDSGWSAPSANGTPGAWTNGGNAYTSNDSYANTPTTGGASVNGSAQGYRNFGLSIPAGNSVDGIQVALEARGTAGGNGTNTCELRTRLSWDNGTSFTDYQTVVPGTSDATFLVGGASNTWGHTWSASEIGNANFVLEVSINDTDSNCITGSTPTTPLYLDEVQVKVASSIDTTAPSVLSIDRGSPESVTNSASATWLVTFSETVTGVDTSDFTLVTTGGISGASITGVSGGPNPYIVTANTGSGDGTLGLNLVDNDTIVDGSSNKLGGVGAGNGSFTGQVYTVDKSIPTVTINQAAGQADPASASPVNFTVVFSEPVSGFTASDVAITGTASVGTSKTITTSTATTYNVAVSGMTTSGTLIANIPAGAAQDGIPNQSTAATFTDNTVQYNHPTWAITASAGTGGTITPSGSVAVNQGSNQAFSIVPSSGYIVSDVLVDGVSQGKLDRYTFSSVTTTHTIDVSFESGWKSPTLSDGTGFTSPDNAFVPDNTYATGARNAAQKYANFGLGIPTGSTINGIEVYVEGYKEQGSTVNKSFDVALSWNNSTYTTAKNTGDLPNTQDKLLILGGPTDTWGRTWSASDFSDANFRARLTAIFATNASAPLDLDQLQVKVFYTLPGHIIVDKVTIPGGASQSFTFTTTGSGYSGFSLTDAAPVNDQTLVAGTYSVSESAVAGWAQDSVVCVSSLGGSELPTAIDLTAGETVTCTFTNKDSIAPTITIVNPNTTPAQSKTVTASTNEGTLTQSVVTSGSVCDGTLTFSTYADTTFTSESDNGKKICYKAVDAALNTTYLMSAEIAGIDTSVGPPSAPDLEYTSDTGSASSDNITGDTTPTFYISGAESNSTITVYADAAVLGTLAIPDGFSSGEFTPSVPMSEGTYVIKAKQTDAAGNVSGLSAKLSPDLTIDTTKPVIASHDPVSAAATGSSGAAVTYTAPATSDNVDIAGVATCAPVSGSLFAIGDTTVNCNATDVAGNPADQTSFTVTVTNNAPVAVDDSATTNEDTNATGNVLTNDTDVEGDTLHAVKVTDPTNGSVTLQSDGSFTYTPAENYNGSDSFTYKANDGHSDSNIATVNITVNAINDAPVITSSAPTTATEDVLYTYTAAATDVDSPSATWSVGPADTCAGSVNPTTGVYTFTPAGPVPPASCDLSVVVKDGGSPELSDTETATVTITAVNDAPTAVADNATTTQDVVIDINVLVNDTDPEKDPLTPVVFSDPFHGAATVNPDKTIHYVPTAGYHGADSFTYKVNDGSANSSDVTVSITVVDNVPPAIAITAPAASALVKGTESVEFTDNEKTAPQCSIDNSVWVACASASTLLSDITGFSGLPQGSFTLYVKDTDLAGNTGNASQILVKDTVAPTVVLSDDHADNIVRDADTVLITATFTEANAIDETVPPTITIHSPVPLVDHATMTKVSNLVWTYEWNVPAGNDGTHTVSISASDTVGNANEDATGKTSYVIDNVAPDLTATFAADGVSMPEAPAGTFALLTHFFPDTHRMIQFGAGTSATETLKSEKFGLYLTDSFVTKADLTAYYNARTELPSVYRDYLIAALDGSTHPFAYIDGGTLKLVDAAKFDLMAATSDMDIPDDYPLGTYTVSGKIVDLAGNEQTVTYTLSVTGDRVLPVISIVNPDNSPAQ